MQCDLVRTEGAGEAETASDRPDVAGPVNRLGKRAEHLMRAISMAARLERLRFPDLFAPSRSPGEGSRRWRCRRQSRGHHGTRRRKPPGLNVSAYFSIPGSGTNSPWRLRICLTASAGPGPNEGHTGRPFTTVSVTTT